MMLFRRIGFSMAAALLCGTAVAGDPRPGEPGYVDVAPARATLQSLGHVGSSPFNPPEQDDATFVVDTGPGLDTGCTFRSGGPLRFEILVDRAFEIADLDRLKQAGLVSDKAIVRVPAYDIDFDGGDGTRAPERDRVYFNGHAVPEEFLTGGDGIWKLNTFQVPIEWVNFRQPGSGVADPGRNEVQIDIDTANTEEVWCTAIDWASLSFRAVRPVVMAHGILSDNSVWEAAWVRNLEAAGVPVSSDINPNMGNLDSIQNNAAKIAAAVAEAKDRWGVDKVNLVTHSKGGLDSRHFAEHSDSVETLVQLGTPNAGSPLADLAQGIVLDVSGLGGSVVVNALAGPAGIQLTRPYMRYYNRHHGYNPQVSYNALAGVYRPQCRFCWDALFARIVGSGDLIVPLESVFALPYTRDTPYFTAGADRSATHTEIEKSSTVYSIMSPLVRTLPQPQLAAFAPEPAAEHSESAIGTISAGQQQVRTVVVDQRDAMIAMLYPEGELGMTLVSPSGRRIDPAVAQADADIDFASEAVPGGKLVGYSIGTPELGTWTIEVAGLSGNDIDYAVASWIRDPRVTLQAGFVHPAVANGEDVVLEATLRDQGAPVLGASARAFLSMPGEGVIALALRDDGSNGDATANDGVYSATRTSGSAGLYPALVIAEGTDAQGHRFSREAFGLATVSHGQAHATAFRDVARDTNGNGYFDELVVEAGVHADAAGDYQVLAELTDSAGHVHQASIRRSLAAGDNTIPLIFAGRDLYRDRIDGPYRLTAFRMAQDNGIELLPTEDLADAHATAAYAYAAFEHDRIEVPGTGLAQGVDADGNGLFDSLDVAVDVDLAQAGYYQWSAQLSDRTGTVLGFYSGAAYLRAGRGALLFNFPGEPIGKHGEDGPYYVTDLLVSGANTSTVIENAFAAQPFQARQFEGYVRDTTPPVLQVSADPSQLWPPNHRMVPVHVKVEATDDLDPAPVVVLVSVTSNEPDNGLGDGDTADDIQDATPGSDDRDVSLRAERSGTGSGRVYTLTYEARDAAGNVATRAVTVTVPVSRR